jgi:hypothetical protein
MTRPGCKTVCVPNRVLNPENEYEDEDSRDWGGTPLRDGTS